MATSDWLVVISLVTAVLGVAAAWISLRGARARGPVNDSLRLRVLELELTLRLAELELKVERELRARATQAPTAASEPQTPAGAGA